MAPIGEMSDRNKGLGDGKDEEEGQNLWATVLSEVQSSSSNKLPPKSILVIGESESGKTTLLAKLQGIEDPKKGSGLEYCYIDVKDEYRDDQTRLGVWSLDGDPHHSGLMKFALSEENFEHTLVLIVASMDQPWAILENLKKWSSILQQHVNRLKISPQQMREYEESLVRHFQEYTAPEENTSSQPQPRRGGPNPLHPAAQPSDEEKVVLPLGETTLTHNIGIPIVVIVTKSDAISTLEKEHEYREEHFDFIQQHIRKFCLNYGASLFYTSMKENKNCDLLYKYLVHRIYGFPFSFPAYVVERDCVFIPSGWDNEKKISILYENMTTMKPDDTFEDVIVKPVYRKPIQRDAEVTAEDEQVFLMKQQTQLSKAPAAGPRESPMRSPGGVQKPTTSPRPGSQSAGSAAMATPKKMDGTKPGAGTNEGVLANFFNSLLSKKTGAAGGPPGAAGPPPTKTTERTAVNRDVAAELDRMTRAKKPVSQTGSTHHNNTAS